MTRFDVGSAPVGAHFKSAALKSMHIYLLVMAESLTLSDDRKLMVGGINNMSLLVSGSLALSCERQVLVSEPPEPPVDSNEPIGDNFLSFGGVIYPLRNGLEGRSSSDLESHKRSSISLADVPYQPITKGRHGFGLLLSVMPIILSTFLDHDHEGNA